MPRIRKKTSNRAGTNDRKKLEHKVKESRKKKAKAAKKNPQWKTKTPKDPGIPNDFPYKDQILAEVAEQRRIAAEEKQRRKDEKQAALKRLKNPDAEIDSDVEAEVREVQTEPITKNLNVGSEGIASLSAKVVNAKLKHREVTPVVEEEEEEDEVPVLINRDLPNIKALLDTADAFVEVLDARDPDSFRSEYLEGLIKMRGKKVLLVLNKIDTCARESLVAWMAHIRTQHPTVLFRSASSSLPVSPPLVNQAKGKGKGKAKLATDDAFGVDSVLACLGQWAKEKKGGEPLTVAVVGVTNVGKSSFINSLLHKYALPVYSLDSASRSPTTTTLPQEVLLETGGKQIRLIDTPGLSWKTEEQGDDSVINSTRARDILLRSRGRIDKLQDPAFVISYIVSRASTEDLMLLYSLPAFAKGDPTAFLSGVAKSNQLIKKKGELDLTGAARIVLRDWRTGKFMRYTTPTVSQTMTTPTSEGLDQLYANDDTILATVRTRKELRISAGLVKFMPGTIETREIDLEKTWFLSDLGSDLDSDEFEGFDLDADEEKLSDDDDDGDDDAEEQDDDEAAEEEDMIKPRAVSRKEKRKRVEEPVPARPVKKVAFAAKSKTFKKSGKETSFKPKVDTKDTEKVKVAKKPIKIPTSALKSKPATSKPKVANAPKKGKAVVTNQSSGNEEVYDFGKFF